MELSKLGKWQDNIANASIGTGTTKTNLLGAGNFYNVPAGMQSIVAVRPVVALKTPTAAQSVVSTLAVTSNDTFVGDFEVPANPIGSGLGTNETTFADEPHWYPANIPVVGGNKVQFWGTAMVANTVAPYMAVDIILSDQPSSSFGPQMHYINNGLNYNGTSTTLGGPTTAGTSTGAQITISGSQPRVLRALYGVVANTTPAASQPINGQFGFGSPSLSGPNPIYLSISATQGFLGTTTAGDLNHISRTEGLEIPLTNMPATFTTTITTIVTLSNAPTFFQTIGYS